MYCVMAFAHYASVDLDRLQTVCPLLPMINDDVALGRAMWKQSLHGSR